MSWDIFVQNIPAAWQTLDEIPDDWQPAIIGSRDEIIKKIMEIVPSANFADPSWGQINAQEYSIEISLRQPSEVTGFAFHVRGGDTAVEIIADILEHLKVRAFDGKTPSGFFDRTISKSSLGGWRSYRDQVMEVVQSINDTPGEKEI